MRLLNKIKARIADTLFRNLSPAVAAKCVCLFDVPEDFIAYGVMLPHMFGITLSPNSIGCDCQIRQNTTIGAASSDMRIDDASLRFRPKIGHLVTTFPGAVISGKIKIGHCSIIAANSVVTKDMPSFHICHGVNNISPLNERQYNILLSTLYHTHSTYKLKCLYMLDGVLKRDDTYSQIREQAFRMVNDANSCVEYLKQNIFTSEYSQYAGITS